jgi:hypothetical protein
VHEAVLLIHNRYSSTQRASPGAAALRPRPHGSTVTEEQTRVAAIVVSPALIWRRHSAAASHTVESSIETIETPRPVARGVTTRAMELGSAEARAARSGESQATMIEQRLIERVAEDVLRRVDKRVRIERERRGI